MESQLRAINADTTLTVEEKTQQMQEVHASHSRKRKEREDDKDSIRVSLHRDFTLGCVHRPHAVKIWCSCCEKFYPCANCHDEAETHALDYTRVGHILCVVCHTVQGLGATCTNCQAILGRTFCGPCLIWDRYLDSFHCSRCNHCHAGRRQDYRYCGQCRACLPRTRFQGHYHVTQPYHKTCLVCQGPSLHHAVGPLHVPRCNHILHRSCYDQLITQDYRCPTCRMSLIDTRDLFDLYTLENDLNPTPPGYQYPVAVYCNDCRTSAPTPNHLLHLSCSQCGSYNVTKE